MNVTLTSVDQPTVDQAPVDRFARQAGLVPRQRLADLTLSVIGVGAIGRHVALQLAALGVGTLQLIDFDQVEMTNVTTQGYLPSDLGRSKVESTALAVRQLDATIRVEPIEDRYRPQLALGDVVFCCVDAIITRAAIWRTAGRMARFWCDGRMLGEVLRILTVAGDRGREHYPTTLFAQSEAQVGSCTAHGVIYTAQIAAGLMVHQFCRYLRDQPIDADLALNLLASELIATA